MSKESYIRGFCKEAQARGYNPEELYKFARSTAQLEQQAARMMKQEAGGVGKTVPLSPKLMALLEKLQKAKKNKLVGYNSSSGFAYAK